MAKHRPWYRVVSMFRRRRSGSGHQSVTTRVDRLRGVHEPNINHTPPGPMMSRLFRDVYRLQQTHVQPRASPQSNSVVNWSSVIFTAGPLGQNLDRFRDFTPKCLSNVNCHGLLVGQESYDNFSPSCWLEDHLHHFARVSEDISDVEDENLSNEITASVDENFTLLSGLNQLQLGGNPQRRGPGDTFRSVGSNSLSVHSSSGPGSRGSTISDVTHFYNNMNLLGFPTGPGQPPPYSERSMDDPPPSYTEVFVPIREGRRQSSALTRASNSFSQDILW